MRNLVRGMARDFDAMFESRRLRLELDQLALVELERLLNEAVEKAAIQRAWETCARKWGVQ